MTATPQTVCFPFCFVKHLEIHISMNTVWPCNVYWDYRKILLVLRLLKILLLIFELCSFGLIFVTAACLCRFNVLINSSVLWAQNIYHPRIYPGYKTGCFGNKQNTITNLEIGETLGSSDHDLIRFEGHGLIYIKRV